MKLIQVPQRSIWLMIIVILTLSYFLIDTKCQLDEVTHSNELIIAQRDSMTILWTDALTELNQ